VVKEGLSDEKILMIRGKRVARAEKKMRLESIKRETAVTQTYENNRVATQG